MKRKQRFSEATVTAAAECLGIEPDRLKRLLGDYPEEVSVRETAEILDVTANTVRQYIRDGDLPARNTATKGAARTCYRLPLKAVEDMRDGYVYRGNKVYPTFRLG